MPEDDRLDCRVMSVRLRGLRLESANSIAASGLEIQNLDI